MKKLWMVFGIGVSLASVLVVYQHIRQTNRLEDKVDELLQERG